MSSTVLKKAYQRWHSGQVPPRGERVAPIEELELGALLGIPSEAVDDYATLASRVELIMAREVRRALVVGATGLGAGASTVAVGLGATLAATTGQTILLVDANLRDPVLHRKFKVPREPGLTEVVREGLPLSQALHSTAVPNLSLLTGGAQVKSPQSFFQLPAFRELLDGWARDYGYVILDSAPFGLGADPSVLAQAASGAVLVVEAARTVREVAAETTEELRRTGVRVLGAVLNRRRYYLPGWIYRRV
jgi:capsular exopolysaccharide synthesis family protein